MKATTANNQLGVRETHHVNDRNGESGQRTGAQMTQPKDTRKSPEKPSPKEGEQAKETREAQSGGQQQEIRGNRPDEATQSCHWEEIVKAADRQPNTVRGFISSLRKKGGEKIESSKSADRERTYKDQSARTKIK